MKSQTKGTVLSFASIGGSPGAHKGTLSQPPTMNQAVTSGHATATHPQPSGLELLWLSLNLLGGIFFNCSLTHSPYSYYSLK